MKSVFAAFFLIACLISVVTDFIFIVPDDPALGFVSMVINGIGIWLACAVIGSKR